MNKLIFLLALTFSFAHTYSQDLKISLDKDSILIGDQFQLTISAKQKPNTEIFLPVLDTIGSFESLGVVSSDTSETELVQKLLLTNFDSGYYQFGPLPAIYKSQSGLMDTVLSNAVLIYVNTLPVDTTEAIMPIKPTLNPEYPWKKVLPKVGIVLLILLVIAVLVYYFIRRRSIQGAPPKPKTAYDYFIDAKSKLSSLEQQRLWQKDQTKEYYLGISEILRTYVEGRFSIQAMESTTDEIITDLDLKKHKKEKLKEVLIQADLAKFAKFKPLGDDNIRMMKLAKDFVLHTKPKREVQEDV